jgi:hypothetical protein
MAKHKPNGNEEDVRNKHDKQMPHHSQSVEAITLEVEARQVMVPVEKPAVVRSIAPVCLARRE